MYEKQKEIYTKGKPHIVNHHLGKDAVTIASIFMGGGAKKGLKETTNNIDDGIKKVGEEIIEKKIKVWNNIKPTQSLYDTNSLIHKSFEINLNGTQKVWVHGNATEHLRELELNILRNTSKTPEAKKLFVELILTDFHEALKEVTKHRIKYDELIKVGRWEFKFSPPRNEGLLPALIHAQPK